MKENNNYFNIIFVIICFILGLLTLVDKSGNFSHFGYHMSHGKWYWVVGLVFITFSIWWGYYTLCRANKK